MRLKIYRAIDPAGARTLKVSGELVIGRDPSCTVVIEDDPAVAARHITARPWGAGIVIEPRALTFVDGKRLAAATPVRSGAAIKIGDTMLEFRPDPPWMDRGGDRLLAVENDARVAERYMGISNPPPPGTVVPPAPLPPRPALPSRRVSPTELSRDPIEQGLLQALRDDPADEATRAAYADWLEEREEPVKAGWVRTGTATFRDPKAHETTSGAWRALAMRGKVVGCDRAECTARWEALRPTPDLRWRDCTTCEAGVYFASTDEEARTCGAHGVRIACDDSLRYRGIEEYRFGKVGYRR